jgi:hypothetical protein
MNMKAKGLRGVAALTAATLAVAACGDSATSVQSGAVVGQMPVDESFIPWGIRWSGAGAGRYEARLRLVDIDGQIALCGVGWLSSGTYAKANRQSLRTKFVTYDGEEILRDFSFFARAGSEAALDGAMANCALTTMPVSADQGGEFDIGGNRSRFSGS